MSRYWLLPLVVMMVIRTVGMSHVRYDTKGKVIFHQDYWDTGVVHERIPVMGAVIRWIKNKF